MPREQKAEVPVDVHGLVVLGHAGPCVHAADVVAKRWSGSDQHAGAAITLRTFGEQIFGVGEMLKIQEIWEISSIAKI